MHIIKNALIFHRIFKIRRHCHHTFDFDKPEFRYFSELIRNFVCGISEFVFILADVDFEQYISRYPLLSRAAAYLLSGLERINALNHVDLTDYLFYLIALKMTDEMELAVLKIKFRALEQDFLNLVFADEIDSAGNSMIYKLDRNSLCHRHELHFPRVSAALQRGFGYLVANLFQVVLKEPQTRISN